jgi:hypothetical protein
MRAVIGFSENTCKNLLLEVSHTQSGESKNKVSAFNLLALKAV